MEKNALFFIATKYESITLAVVSACLVVNVISFLQRLRCRDFAFAKRLCTLSCFHSCIYICHKSEAPRVNSRHITVLRFPRDSHGKKKKERKKRHAEQKCDYLPPCRKQKPSKGARQPREAMANSSKETQKIKERLGCFQPLSSLPRIQVL